MKFPRLLERIFFHPKIFKNKKTVFQNQALQFNYTNINTISIGLITPKTRVLDLGCGPGMHGNIMRKQLGCHVIGVEINNRFAATAQKMLNKVITGDIEKIDIFKKAIKYGPYDLIFASGIMEHLVHPEVSLKQLARLLKKNGCIILTLPNIAYWRCRFDLLLGQFDYTDNGVMDKTHLHLYTLKTAKQLINCSNYRILYSDFEFPEFPILHRIFKIIPHGETLLFKFYSLFPAFFAYQLLFKIRTKK